MVKTAKKTRMFHDVPDRPEVEAKSRTRFNSET